MSEQNINSTSENSNTEQPKKGEKKKGRVFSKAVNKVILVISVIILLFSGSLCVKYASDIIKNHKAAEQIADLTDPVFAVPDADYSDTVFPDGIQEIYKKAYSVNSDLVGWIKVQGTTINHPVVKSSDNNYYLRHNFYKNYERRGTAFADYRNNITADGFDTNTIIYGHNYLDSTMFSDLEKYKDIEFYKANPIIDFNTIYHNYKWKIIAVFLTNADEKDDNGYIFNYIYPFMYGENYSEYFEEIATRSLYATGVDVNSDDKILSLSTCTRDMDIRGNGETNARCVVVARLVRDGESAEVDTSLAVKNENPRYPQIWYDKNKTTNPYKNAEKWYPKGVIS